MANDNGIPIDLFDAWVRHLQVNPFPGQDCPGGFWWEDVCWDGRIERAQHLIAEEFRRQGITGQFRVYQDARGNYCVVQRARVDWWGHE
jgi:hypothetical protein